MKSKTLYFFIIFLLFASLYFFVFIKPKSIESPSIISMCKRNDKIEINLIDTFHYIQRYETQKNRDTIFLEVYLTTVGNFLAKDKSLQFYIKNDAKYLKIKDKIIKTSDIANCK